MSTELEGKVVLVTGAAGGFGRVIARAFVEAGARVGLCDVNANAVVALAAEFEAEFGDGRALALPADIGDPAACTAVVGRLAERFGGLHVLVNNAALSQGVVSNDYFTRTVQIEDIPDDLWQKFMAVNLSGAFFLARAAVPLFRQQGWGRIINVTTSFLTMIRAGFAPYGPSKAALEAWSSCLAGELEGSGITVNVVVPGGPADTAMVPVESGFDRSQLVAPQRMAPPILWLCGEAGGRITGARFLAVDWDPESPPVDPGVLAAPIAWPGLGAKIAWPEGAPRPGLGAI